MSAEVDSTQHHEWYRKLAYRYQCIRNVYNRVRAEGTLNSMSLLTLSVKHAVLMTQSHYQGGFANLNSATSTLMGRAGLEVRNKMTHFFENPSKFLDGGAWKQTNFRFDSGWPVQLSQPGHVIWDWRMQHQRLLFWSLLQLCPVILEIVELYWQRRFRIFPVCFPAPNPRSFS